MNQKVIKNWTKAYQIPIKDSDEALIKMNTTDKIIIEPVYFNQNVDGALADCFLREGVYLRLYQAAKRLPNHLMLKVYDGYRPYSVQKCFFDDYKKTLKATDPQLSERQIEEQATQFVSKPSTNPLSPAPHITGGSVDLTLCHLDGTPLDMGTEFDDFSEQSYTHNFDQSNHQQIKQNRAQLLEVMQGAGFTNLPSEWWHFDYGNQLWAFFSQKEFAIYGYIKSPVL